MGHGSWPHESVARGSVELSPALLGKLARQMDLELEPAQCERLVRYACLLHRWNRVHNLTAIGENAAVLTRHLLDCLAIVRPLEQALALYQSGFVCGQAVRFLDAGSGAGLPGLALAIARPAWRGTLVDAVQKKCAFLQQARIELHLSNVTVRHARLESGGFDPHELIVSRAFSSLREFVERTRGLLTARGLWAAMKGRNPVAEAADLPPDVELLETVTLRVPQLHEQRHLVILRPKAARTRSTVLRNS
ncbi:MAG TPA: 16S rRNA (guanine(527)-N(7))-methyltransferase RsmG [Burkholderiaceae bacterium]|nr:16S rRNA (guanine(527)-N(7))-methyltransferase RsmG [Burkholderiaceae bacterium]